METLTNILNFAAPEIPASRKFWVLSEVCFILKISAPPAAISVQIKLRLLFTYLQSTHTGSRTLSRRVRSQRLPRGQDRNSTEATWSGRGSVNQGKRCCLCSPAAGVRSPALLLATGNAGKPKSEMPRGVEAASSLWIGSLEARVWILAYSFVRKRQWWSCTRW